MRASLCAAAAVLVAASAGSVVSAQDVKVLSSEKFEKGDRAVLGITTASGGRRDTIGVLVSDVTVGGPADKVGIQEGDRIVSIGDVDLRLAPADASDHEMVGIMGRRLAHAIEKHAPGDVVDLKIYHDGQFVTRRVTTAKASEVFIVPVVKFDTFDPDAFNRQLKVQLRQLPQLPPIDTGAFQFEMFDGGSRHRI